MSAEVLKIVGECIGLVAVAEGFFVFLSNRRERILIFKFISDFLWLLNQLCLGGYTGALLNFVAMGREVVFYNRDKRRFAQSILWLYFFLAVTVASPLFSLISGKEGWYAILPALGSVAAVIGFYSRRPAVTRYTSFAANGLWLAYDVIVGNITATVSCAILLLSALVGTLRALWQQKTEKQ